jgi:hypothetical protein
MDPCCADGGREEREEARARNTPEIEEFQSRNATIQKK